MNELDAAVAATLELVKVGVVVVRGPAAVVDALAANWARDRRNDFDIEVSADLVPWRRRGGVDLHSLTPVFLQALRGWAWPLPETFAGRVAEYREQAARRKVLIRLRNPDQAAQVRPWTAGLPGSVVLVTSRRLLGGLVTEGAAFLDLNLPEGHPDRLTCGKYPFHTGGRVKRS
ncbi:hypothetical protein [Amycolatopsis sp. NPDC021455]|uniref:hypothetical protein n=1 Tax=Amycolatopsis sp. NPDC021455 TaxID=3154901 RepID=UPI0033CCA21C